MPVRSRRSIPANGSGGAAVEEDCCSGCFGGISPYGYRGSR